MKTLKLEHSLADMVRAGKKTSTWRMFDDKNVSTGDVVELVDKVDPARRETWQVMGTARIDQVVEKQLGSMTADEMQEHNYASVDEMLTTFKGYYGSVVSLTTNLKIIRFTFNKEQQRQIVSNTTTRLKKVKIFADGGSRGNPGPSASGYVIINPETDEVLVDEGVYLGVTNNNQAEYLALKYALETVQKMGAREVDVYLDSMLVVNQMKGIFKIKNRDLWPIHDSIRDLVASFGQVTFTHVPREQNSLADAAVNRALDSHLNDPRPDQESYL
jgi:ribonuclease HI